MENVWLESTVEVYQKYFGDTANNIWDVGTRDGDDAEYLREKLNVPQRHVYCIDANPIAINETRRRYPNFNVFETAVGNHNGATKFMQIVSSDKNWAGTSSLDVGKIVREGGNGLEHHVLDVPMARLDSILSGFWTDDSIDIMKIDVETYTYETLQGLGDYLQLGKVYHLETETRVLREGHMTSGQVKVYMEDRNFQLADVSYEWGPGIQDQVWVNKSLAGLD